MKDDKSLKKEHLLSVQDLHTSFFTDSGEVHAVNGVSFNLDPGEILGIVDNADPCLNRKGHWRKDPL